MKGWKIVFALFITTLTILGFLSFPHLDYLIETCTGSFLCGKHVGDALDYLGKTDTAAIDFGKFLYNKAITGTIVFIITLLFAVFAQRIYAKFTNKGQSEDIVN